MDTSQLTKSAAILFVFLLLFSCQDDAIEMETNLLPEDEQFFSSEDTYDVTCFTEKMDIITTFKRLYFRDEDDDDEETAYSSPTAMPFGSVIDPDFGSTQIDFYWKCFVRDSEDDIIYDSTGFNYRAVIQLYTYELYNFGDTSLFNFEVYEFTDLFPGYYEDSSNFKITDDMYDHTNLVDTVEYIYDYEDDPEYLYMINIYLDTAYSHDLVRMLDNNDDDTIEIDEVLYDSLKLYIKPSIKTDESDVGGIQLYQTGEASSSSSDAEDYVFYSTLNIYYDYLTGDTIESSSGEDDSVETVLDELLVELAPFDQFYTVEHTHTNTILDAIDEGTEADLLYVQSIAGTQLHMNFDSTVFAKYRNTDTLINRVELVIPVESGYLTDKSNGFYPPTKLGMKVIISKEKVNGGDSLVHLEDEYSSYSSSSGSYTYSSLLEGTYDSDREAYIINITGQVLNTYILDEAVEDNITYYKPEFIIFGTSSSTWSTIDRYRHGRLILNSPNNDNPMYMRVLYTIKPEL